MYRHLAKQTKQQKVHNNYVALLIKQFVFTKFSEICLIMGRSKTRKSFSEIFKSEFSILAIRQNGKLGFKNLGKKLPSFPSFRPGHYQRDFTKLFFFQYSTVGNSVLSIYVMFCFQSLLKCFFLHQKYMYKILSCHNEIYLS